MIPGHAEEVAKAELVGEKLDIGDDRVLEASPEENIIGLVVVVVVVVAYVTLVARPVVYPVPAPTADVTGT